MIANTIETLLLVGVAALLLICGYGLEKNIKAIHSRESVAKEHRLGYSEQSGIDLSGRLVHKSASLNISAKRRLFFVLHSGSLSSDLLFWQSVASMINKDGDDVHLVGYCDDQKCAEDLNRNSRGISFTVLAYGTVLNMEALTRADSEGSAILLNGSQSVQSSLPWRIGQITPSSLLREALK